ncbi:hypothetical protein L7F22_009453 [Adiantum nelumboides]|nr:hypothetical protein [Adiantum nelumboides]
MNYAAMAYLPPGAFQNEAFNSRCPLSPAATPPGSIPIPGKGLHSLFNQVFEHGKLGGHHILREDFPVEDPPKHSSLDPQNRDICQEDAGSYEGITILDKDMELWHSQLRERVVIGMCHGIHPSMETLKAWTKQQCLQQWTNKNIRLCQVQFLPNNYFLFFFEDASDALQVVSHSQWLIRNTPMAVFNWFPGFNPRGPRPTKVSIWVDFPEMPIEFYPWLKLIGGWIGRVLGQRARGGFNPKWDPQLLIEVDTGVDLNMEIPIKSSSGSVIHMQRVTYKNLPNACFHCLKQASYKRLS